MSLFVERGVVIFIGKFYYGSANPPFSLGVLVLRAFDYIGQSVLCFSISSNIVLHIWIITFPFANPSFVVEAF